MRKNRSGYFVSLTALMFLTLIPLKSFAAESPISTSAVTLPDAPTPRNDSDAKNAPSPTGDQVPAKGATLSERFLNEVDPGYLHVGDKWDVTINRGEIVRPFTRIDKLHYSLEEEWSPFTIFEAAWSAGYEQLRDGVPHFGNNEPAYGERYGAAVFRQGTYRLFGDGVFPALTHEDPRYYRVAEGSLGHRALLSVLQVVVAHKDDGSMGPNYSTLAGEVVSNSLPLTFYPQRDQHASVIVTGVAFSLLDDAGLKLLREFLPDAFRAVKLIPPQQ